MFAGSGVVAVAGRLDLPMCRRTTTTIKVTRAIRTSMSLEVSIVLVSRVREDWGRVGAEYDLLLICCLGISATTGGEKAQFIIRKKDHFGERVTGL